MLLTSELTTKLLYPGPIQMNDVIFTLSVCGVSGDSLLTRASLPLDDLADSADVQPAAEHVPVLHGGGADAGGG